MAKGIDLKKAISEEYRAYRKKRNAYDKYQVACEKEHELYEEVASTWGEFKKAEKDFRATFNENSIGIPSSDEPWQKFLCIKARNTPEIARLKQKIEAEEDARIEILKQIEGLRKDGHLDEIGGLKLEAKDHEDVRKRISSEIQDLRGEITEAKMRAEKSELYLKKKKRMEEALAHHQSAKWEHKNAKKERDRLKSAYEKAKIEHEEAVEKLKEERAKIAKK